MNIVLRNILNDVASKLNKHTGDARGKDGMARRIWRGARTSLKRQKPRLRPKVVLGEMRFAIIRARS